jgi:hypothetical protein
MLVVVVTFQVSEPVELADHAGESRLRSASRVFHTTGASLSDSRSILGGILVWDIP